MHEIERRFHSRQKVSCLTGRNCQGGGQETRRGKGGEATVQHWPVKDAIFSQLLSLSLSRKTHMENCLKNEINSNRAHCTD